MTTATQAARAGSRGSRVAIILGLVWLLAAQPALAENPRHGAPESPDGDLKGVVYDAAGLPLIGALIAILVPGAGPAAAVGVTDSRGQFLIEGLPPGVYTVMAHSLGFVQAALPGVVVPRQEPVNLQLRPEPVQTLLSSSAPLDLGFAFRSRVRDVLFQTEAGVATVGNSPAPAEMTPRDGWVTSGGSGRHLFGEVSLWTIAPFPGTEPDSGGATEVALGSPWDGHQSWILRAQVGDGGQLRARGDITRALSDTHALQIGVGYLSRDLGLTGLDEEADRMWVGSLAAEDRWALGEALQVAYGLRFEHYNYLDDRGVISPRVQVAWAPVEALVLSTAVAYDAEAPGLAELRFEIDPMAVRYMDILTTDGVEPERTLRYEFGLQRSTPTTEVRARAFVDEIEDELLAVYSSAPRGSGYMVYNLGEAVTRGFELNVRRTFMDRLAGHVGYAFGQRSGAPLPADLLTGEGDSALAADLADIDTMHELRAGVETVVGSYSTRLGATYRWRLGVPVLRHGDLGDVYEQLDLRVRQPLPFKIMASEWSALVQVHNVLGRHYDGAFDLSLGEVPILSRLVTGGVAVRF